MATPNVVTAPLVQEMTSLIDQNSVGVVQKSQHLSLALNVMNFPFSPHRDVCHEGGTPEAPLAATMAEPTACLRADDAG